MSAAPRSAPCRLTQEKVLGLDERGRVPLRVGLCQNGYEDAEGNILTCGKPVGSHPREAVMAVGGWGPYGSIVNYTTGNVIYDFWCAVIQTDKVRAGRTRKALVFNDGAKWGWSRDVSELLVRDCYTSLVEKLRHVDMAMLEGTPGIGKSMFIFYYIYYVVVQAREKNEKIPTFIISDRDACAYFLGVDSTGKGVVHIPTTETPDYHITDTVGCPNANFIKQYIHVSSINNTNVKGVYKVMEQRSSNDKKHREIIYLPVFTSEEYLEIDSVDERNEANMKFYYDVFGGCLRSLRSVDQEISENHFPGEIYSVVEAEMTSFFGGAELAGVSFDTWKKTAMVLARKLKNSNDGIATALSRSILIHWSPSEENPNDWRDIPATRFMRHLIGHINDTSNKDAFARLRNVIGHSGVGFVHEHDAHQFRLKHLGKSPGITLWSLQGEPEKQLHLPINRVVRIRTVSDIARLEVGDYGLPTVSNFPFTDAVINGYLFQDTIAMSHPSVAKVPEILQALNRWKVGRNATVLVNTLSTDNFDNFKMNKSGELNSFSQWMECHVDDVAVTKTPFVATASGRHVRSKREFDKSLLDSLQPVNATGVKPASKPTKQAPKKQAAGPAASKKKTNGMVTYAPPAPSLRSGKRCAPSFSPGFEVPGAVAEDKRRRKVNDAVSGMEISSETPTEKLASKAANNTASAARSDTAKLAPSVVDAQHLVPRSKEPTIR